jgi:hypothetical protein
VRILAAGHRHRCFRYSLLLAINLVSIAALSCATELYLRWRGLRPYRRAYPGQHAADPRQHAPWAEPDPNLGWTVARTFRAVNREGFPSPTDFALLSREHRAPRVMVLGDSFAFGAGVRADASFPALLQRAAGNELEVHNLGVPGWGIDQMYLAYRQYGNVIQPAHVILAFVDDDVSRVLESYRPAEGLDKPSFAIEGTTLVARGPATTSERLLNKLSGRSALLGLIAREFHLAREGRPIVRQIFHEMVSETRSRGQRLSIVRIPTRIRTIASATRVPAIPTANRCWNDFRDVFEGTDVVYIDPSEEAQKHRDWEAELFLSDGHLSEAGHEFIARQIIARTFKRGPESWDRAVPPHPP